MKRRVGFIGIGNMGKGVCHNIIKAENAVSIYDTNKEAMKRFEQQAHCCEDVGEVFERSEVVFLSLPNSNVVQMVMQEGFEVGIEGKLIVDLSTSYPIATKELYKKVREKGGHLVDSPLIAGPKEAWEATLTAVVGGDEEVVKKYDDLFLSYCKSYEYVGECGNAHLTKLAQNWAGLMQAVMYAQLYPVMAKHGLPPQRLYEVLNTEFFDNWFFKFYSDKYVNKNYRMDFALELGLKDLTYMKKLCDELSTPGFMLDGAIDLCRVALKEGKDKGLEQDLSHVADTMYQYVGID